MDGATDGTDDFDDSEDFNLDLDQLMPMLSPEEAFAPVPGKPDRRVRVLRWGFSDAFVEIETATGSALVTLLGIGRRFFVEALYADGWREWLHWGIDPDAAHGLAREVALAYGVPVERWDAPPYP